MSGQLQVSQLELRPSREQRESWESKVSNEIKESSGDATNKNSNGDVKDPRGPGFESSADMEEGKALDPPMPPILPDPTSSAHEASSSKDFSDLEVVVTISANAFSDEKTAIVLEGNGSFRRRSLVAADADMVEPAPAYAPSEHSLKLAMTGGSSTTTAPLNSKKGAIFPFVDLEAQGGRSFCGLSQKRFLMVVAGLTLLILVLGLGLGLGLRNRSGSGGLLATSAKPAIMSNSQLTATNWTDSSNIGRTAVFYQDESNALMVANRDSVSNKWSYVNVTASVMNSSQVTGLDVLPGTPLACMSSGSQVNLYYLTSQYLVAELWSPPPATGQQWYVGEIQTKLPLQSAPGTHLAAYWPICPNCTNSLLVLYQADTGALRMGNWTNGIWASSDWVAEADAGTGLSLSAYTDSRGTGATGTAINALRTYHVDDGGLIETAMGPEDDFKIETGNSSNAISSGISTKPSPQVTSITYGSNGWTNNLVTYLNNNGTMLSHVYRGTAWEVNAPTFQGGPVAGANVTAIATTQSMTMHAMVDRQIHEYQTSQSNPFAWKYVGPVTV